MALNKLDNFIKNTEGRILYVSPSDLDSTDSISNSGNSLAQPFKTIQRALLEAARFSYLNGKNNDLVEKTTILLFPGEHIVDNRPGYAIYANGQTAYAVPPTGGVGTPAQSVLSLELDSNFDLTQEDNILYKFNSIYGGVVVPRGTSIVGLDLRKTKIRPKYVPNPTDPAVKKSAIFRVTGACYFWQFSIFDGDGSGLVYTHPTFFTSNYQSNPKFSHHKLTCFEYADGVNVVDEYNLTDLDMYYSKLSNAYNSYRDIPIDSKFPNSEQDFAKRDPEWQIVGAFASDPIKIEDIFAGDGSTVDNRVNVTTSEPHNLNVGTPIKIKGVSESEYNISTTVQSVINETQFSYLLETFPINLDATPSTSGATVTVETDTVSGASPYIFNCSLRSVWGMNGLYADGSKASGFRSMVVAQFTAVSLQKDDRAFVKYDKETRSYNGVVYNTVYGNDLSSESSQTNSEKIYHLDPDAIYRQGWESSHLKISNDGFIQIVSVFAIGFNKHFDLESGADASITNSNSNFGQISLSSDGFKTEAFDKDNKAYITSIIPPRDIELVEEDIEWLSIDVGLTTSVGNSGRLYLYGFNSLDSTPVSVTQGYRIGARNPDFLYLKIDNTEYSARIYMQNSTIDSRKIYNVSAISNSTLTIGTHQLITGEKIIINSETGDLPENVTAHIVYYTIRVNSTQIRLATSLSNALNQEFVTLYGGTGLKVYSRVSDKIAGEIGSPIQFDFDEDVNNWYITVNTGNQIYNQLVNLGTEVLSETTDLAYIKRIVDDRSLDEKLYKFRVSIPKELSGSKDPQNGFIIQESSTTGARTSDFTRTSITVSDYEYKRNQRFITTCTVGSNNVTVLTELPHNLTVGDIVIIRNVTDDSNPTGEYNLGYNGKFRVTSISGDMIFSYSKTDLDGIIHLPTSSSTNNINNRTTESQVRNLPRFERNDLQTNLYVYKNEVISPHISDSRDGIYHLSVLNASNAITEEFTNQKYSQNIVNLYPQLDRDNIDPNPPSAKTFALRSPLGDVNTSDLKKSITRETVDKALISFGLGFEITEVETTNSSATLTFDREHGLGGIIRGSFNSPTANYNPGTHYDVKLLNDSNDPSVGTWRGATAKVVVSLGGDIDSLNIINPGSSYFDGDQLYLDSTRVGNGNGTYINAQTAGITTNIGDVVQITGIGTEQSGHFRIQSILTRKKIVISRTSSDLIPKVGQYAFLVGPSIKITSITSRDSITGISTFTTSSAHGLLSGNKFTVIDSSDNFRGSFVVKDRTSVTKFTAITPTTISAANGYVLKHGLSENQGESNIREENFGSRQITFYDKEIAKLNFTISDEIKTLSISLLNSSIGMTSRFPIGSYIQIDNEIMRILFFDDDSNLFEVIRGALGTKQELHLANSLIRKIKPIPIEFRRPSILRASGHTFEYLGYGPGNYSTALPQVQVKSLAEREEFLVQSQEKSGGIVVYTGMNNNGDFFSGNTKTSSVSGDITSYDIPRPTVTGEDPSKSSVVYDEVTVRERLLVEGGNSGTVLSQFDGPVTFNKQIRAKDTVSLSGLLRSLNETSSTSVGKGAITVKGGVGIGENLNVGGSVVFSNITNALVSETTGGALQVLGGVRVSKRIISEDLRVNDNATVGGEIVVEGADGITSPKFKATIPLSDTIFNELTYAMLRSNGSQDFVTSREITNALGYVAANIAAISGDFPIGNSLVCDDISDSFNGSRKVFTLRINGNLFVPAGSSANLIVSIDNVIKKPGFDFFIVNSQGQNTSEIEFTAAPSANSKCFIIALGGQGSLVANVDWTEKGQLVVGKSNTVGKIISVGSDGEVLTADSTREAGVRWAPGVPIGAVFYMANSSIKSNLGGSITSGGIEYNAPEGYMICNGAKIESSGNCQGVNVNRLNKLKNFLGKTYSNTDDFRLPDLIGNFIGYSIKPGETGGYEDASLVEHDHGGATLASGRHGHKFLRSKDNQADDWESYGGFVLDTHAEYEERAANIEQTLDPGLKEDGVLIDPGKQISGPAGGDTIGNGEDEGRHEHSIRSQGVAKEGRNIPPYLGMIPVIKY